MSRIVMAHAGGVATLAAIPWLTETEGAEIVTVTLDVGQGPGLADVRERALAAGAVRAHVVDAREEFARGYVLPALRAGVALEDGALATWLARPLIAKWLAAVARMEDAGAIAHACTDAGAAQLWLEAARLLDPAVRVIAITDTRDTSHAEMLEGVRARGIVLPAASERAFRVRGNLWARSITAPPQSSLADPPEDAHTLTRAPQDCPGDPASLEIEFDAGVPVRANGVEMPLLEMIESLRTIAGAHGVGRGRAGDQRMRSGEDQQDGRRGEDQKEEGRKGQGRRRIAGRVRTGIPPAVFYEAPAAVVLHAAHGELERLVLPRDLRRIKDGLAEAYTHLLRGGRWFSDTRAAIDAFAASIQPRVSGAVRLQLLRGTLRVVSSQSPFAVCTEEPRPSQERRDGRSESSMVRQVRRGS